VLHGERKRNLKRSTLKDYRQAKRSSAWVSVSRRMPPPGRPVRDAHITEKPGCDGGGDEPGRRMGSVIVRGRDAGPQRPLGGRSWPLDAPVGVTAGW
jgi:hypothetical protein